MQFMGYDENKLVQIIDEWERRKWDKEMLAAKEAKMPTKHIMTRAEAIECFTKHMPWTGNSAEKVINFYIAAGMLEIKEELSPREKFRQACSDLGHPEATVFGHWALKAYDVANDTKF